jgi:hypothetical protein
MKRRILNLLLVLSAFSFISWGILFFYFHDGHLPSTPQPSVGRVYASSNHGSVVYLTLREEIFLMSLPVLAGIFFYVTYRLNEKWSVWVDPLRYMSTSQRFNILHGRKK